MPITFGCPGCGKTLRVGDENAGKLARCPDCGAVATIPVSSAPAASIAEPTAPAAAPTSPVGLTDSNPSLRETALHPGSASGVNSAIWMMRTENGKAYGPVNKATLDDWYQQGRIASFHFLSSDHGQTWMAAPDAYPQLKQAATGFQPSSPGNPSSSFPKTSANPFSDAPAQAPSTYSVPHGAMSPMGGYGLPAGQGGLLLTLSIFGFCCFVFAIVSLILGIRELTEINAGRLRPEAKGLAMASVIISTIALLISAGGIVINILGNMR